MPKTIEEHRAFWAEIAKENGWYVSPFFIQVWKNKDGSIRDSVSFRGIKNDIIIEE